MDKKLIKMFEKAEEIQENAPEMLTKFMAYERDKVIISSKGNYFIRPRNHSIPAPFYISPVIWLPTQEQLQKMVKRQTPQMLVSDFATFEWGRFYRIHEKPYYMEFTSMNQLWLAFVMWEKYKKVWNEDKEEWEKV